MSTKYVLALDQGTTSSRAILFDNEQNIIAVQQREFEQIYPQQGWVEHNPMEIWSTQYGVMNEVVAQSGVDVHDIAAIGITNQRETTILWEKATGMLYNIRTLDWDDTLLKALDIPRCILPRVTDSSEVYGTTDLCGVQIPVAGIAGDQQAALFGQSCFGKGEAKNTYGTGCFLLMNTGDTICRSQNGLISTIAISLNGRVEYALEGSVFVGGAVIQWVRDGLRMIQESRDAEYYAQKVPDNGGVYIVPAFTGLGAPYWDMYARGAIVGITRGTTQNHIIRAAEESIAYQSADLVAAMEKDIGVPITSLKVDGGASRDQFLMQFQADILNKTVLRPAIRETTALGAAYLAGLATGVWKDRDEIRSLWHCNMTFAPQMDETERTRLLAGWHKAVGRSSDWAEH